MEIDIKAPEAKPVDRQKAVQPSVMTVKLLKHWTPSPDEELTILGWNKPAVVVKLATGGSQELEAAKFVQGEMAPPPVPGATNTSSSHVPTYDANGRKTGMKEETYTKIWAGTYVEVVKDTAKRLIDTQAAQVFIQ